MAQRVNGDGIEFIRGMFSRKNPVSRSRIAGHNLEESYA